MAMRKRWEGETVINFTVSPRVADHSDRITCLEGNGFMLGHGHRGPVITTCHCSTPTFEAVTSLSDTKSSPIGSTPVCRRKSTVSILRVTQCSYTCSFDQGVCSRLELEVSHIHPATTQPILPSTAGIDGPSESSFGGRELRTSPDGEGINTTRSRYIFCAVPFPGS